MDSIDIAKELKNFLDDEGRLTKYPAKAKLRTLSLFYLASKFEQGKIYTEKEVNELLKAWHTFGDFATLRRELYNKYLLGRKADGSEYWLEEEALKLPE